MARKVVTKADDQVTVNLTPDLMRERYSGGASFAKDVTDALRSIVSSYIVGDGVKDLKADLASLRPVDRVVMVEKFLKYVLPTMGTISVAAQNADEDVKITVRYESKKPVIDDDDTEKDYSEDF